jgi:hypothetical protein
MVFVYTGDYIKLNDKAISRLKAKINLNLYQDTVRTGQ